MCLIPTCRDIVAAADERQLQEALVGEEALGELVIVHPQESETRVTPRLRGLVGDGSGPQSIDEPAQLGGRHRLARDVEEVDVDAAFPEEAQGGARGLRVGGAEDLNAGPGHGRRVPGATIAEQEVPAR